MITYLSGYLSNSLYKYNLSNFNQIVGTSSSSKMLVGNGASKVSQVAAPQTILLNQNKEEH